MSGYLPSIEVVRQQTAVVRALTDQVEYLARAPDAESLRGQLVEEMARLGCMLLEAAASLSDSTDPAAASAAPPPIAADTVFRLLRDDGRRC